MGRFASSIGWFGRQRVASLVLLGAVLLVCAVSIAAPPSILAGESSAAGLQTPTDYGLWVLAPPVVAIVLAVLTRQVVAALFLGTLVAAYMLLPFGGDAAPYADSHYVIAGVRVAVEKYIVGGIVDFDGDLQCYYRVQIMVFTLTIGAMVGVVGANGGTRAMVEVLSRWAKTSRRGQVVGWVGGHAVFFDDYANTMILGPTLRPLYDRLRISRAKLAYIVDSTAAPVASLVPIGTWIGAEISYIKDGLDNVAASGNVPSFLEGVSGYSAFLSSIGYRYYAIFALALVIVIALTRRDFGPMKRAERESASGVLGADQSEATDEVRGRWWYALAPVLVMVGLTVAVLLVPGWRAFPEDQKLSLHTMRLLLSEADPYRSILYGALAGLTLALLISVASRTLRLRKAVESGLDGMCRMFPAIVILVLAWSLSDSTRALQLGEVVTAKLQGGEFPAVYLPMAVFGAACLISFATGTSWGTMGILCPVAVEVAAGLCADLPTDQALPLFYSAVGAVLAGAIFGDHCSPISDTTVLSSLASSCRLEEHVWTQLPYALLAAAASVVAGNVLCNVFGRPWWTGLLAGLVLLLAFVLIVGRRPPAPTWFEEHPTALM
ncbi:MAG: Na+/H+ antiporter NhaC family protein [Planctomycetota bacterium]|jgi:Na+/H+ antiporter NhaC